MTTKYIALLFLLAFASASPAPEPEPQPEPQPLIKTVLSGGLLGGGGSISGSLSTGGSVFRSNTLLYLNPSLGVGHICGITDIVSILTTVNLGGLLGGIGIERLLKIEIIISFLERMRTLYSGFVIILDLEVNVIRLVSIDVVISSLRSRDRFTKGILILNVPIDLGPTVDLNAIVSGAHCSNVITSSTRIGSVIEFGLAKLRTPCGSCGRMICLPRILILDTLVCKIKFPFDWVYAIGAWRRNTCPVCR